ncbi:MAG: hypothetical protein KZQ72_15230 [Candidatus Thiodiazotropha sp. (ex Cardiolucina cf. quadrata)]|nr:hypothetical protein [Candidatus Thiodiazotropha sp. (ex Cardiolucina cf. quadrata)]
MSMVRQPLAPLFVALIFFVTADLCDATEAVNPDGTDAFVPVQPFSAVLVDYNRHNEETKRRTRLVLSRRGMRSESLSPQPGLVLIQNYQTGQEWLANPGMHIFSELSEGRSVGERDVAVDNQENPIGVLLNRPCVGMTAKKQSTRAVGETELSVWRCTDSRGQAHLQHYSTLLGVVIRQETEDGQISELQEIALTDDSPVHFEPSNLWREVSLGEFVNGAPILPDYDD